MNKKQSLFDEFIEALHEITDFAGKLGFAGSVEHLLKLDEHKIELAYTILLVNVACIDNDFSPRESYFIKKKLQDHLGMTYTESIDLVKRATKLVLEKDIDLDQFGEYLSEHLPQSKRQLLIENIDGLIDEDRLDHPFEKHLRDKYVRLLGVNDLNES